ncbi:MAG: isocitrate lyase/phosphoenolpyruvate mutase family protein, partial [Bacteroidia bacterium]
MTDVKMQHSKALQFHKLHHNGKMLVLPNIWDPLGALLLEKLEYPAIATASASIAFTGGYD